VSERVDAAEAGGPDGGAGWWSGRRVLVTGASSGIGAALARELARAGAVVGLCARRTELLDAVLADCRRATPASQAWTVDLADLDAVDAFARQAEQALGGIDVLVHNAALSNYHASADATPWTDLEYLIRLNYLSPVRLTRALLPGLVARDDGRIVVVSSMAARMSAPGESAYSASKAALSAWFEALATEHWGGPLRVHLVYPALIDLTPGLDGDDSLADTPNGGDLVPAPVLARAMLRQVERGELELHMPHVVRDSVVSRAHDLPASMAMMARWYQRGAPTAVTE
jgi:NAD(P)-dependent dehydrogenase (short-subunit alcohol dehydrogenase family)